MVVARPAQCPPGVVHSPSEVLVANGVAKAEQLRAPGASLQGRVASVPHHVNEALQGLSRQQRAGARPSAGRGVERSCPELAAVREQVARDGEWVASHLRRGAPDAL